MSTSHFYRFPNDGTGRFGRRIPIADGPEFNGSFAAVVSDVDGDGTPEIAAASWGA